MPTLKILIFPDPRLRTVATAVSSVDEKIKALVIACLKLCTKAKALALQQPKLMFIKNIRN